jgi:hypothetical protein
LIQSDLKRFGMARTCYDLGLRTINVVALAKVFKVLVMDVSRPEFLQLPAGFRSRFLTETQLRARACDPCNELTDEFLDDALAKGDECYAVLDGAKLACYSWYSSKPTVASDGLSIHFNPAFVYGYKAFTLPDYRGQRLHAIEVSRALEAYLARGFRGTIAYVESHNFASLRSCYRMGYRDVGRTLALGIGGRPWAWTGRGCRAFGCRFRPSAVATSAGTQVRAVERRELVGAGS